MTGIPDFVTPPMVDLAKGHIRQDYSLADGDNAHGWGRNIDELYRIRDLHDDWDGEGSEAPPVSLVDGAIVLAQRLKANGWPVADRVVASVNGTVYFEWHYFLRLPGN